MSDILAQIKNLIRHHHLLWDLAIKDLEVRYRSPVLGFLWSILIPLVTVFMFHFVFSTLMKTQTEDYPFFLYLVTAVFPWSYFSTAVSTATESIPNNSDLIKRTFFPRQILPLSVVLASLLNFIPALVVMLLSLVFFKMQFSFLIFLLPVAVLLQTMLAIGLALMLSSVHVLFRDTKYIVEIAMMAWFYLSPAFYSLSLVAAMPSAFFKLYMLNPFVGLFILYRTAFFKDYLKTLPASVNVGATLAWTVAVCVCVFFAGFLMFKKHEPRFADLV